MTTPLQERISLQAADHGVTVNELHNPQIRKVLASTLALGRVSPETWSGVESRLRTLTAERSGTRVTCSSCGELVVWVESGRRQKAMPIDPLPTPSGNLRLERLGRGQVAHVLRKGEAWKGPRFRSHFATCPFGPSHRRRPKAPDDRPAAPRVPPGERGDAADSRCDACGERLSQQLVDAGESVHWLCGPEPAPERHLRVVPDLSEGEAS